MQSEQVKAQLEQARIFKYASSFQKFWNKKYYQNEFRFNGVYSRTNLPKINDECICNKSSWVWINRNSLDSFVCDGNIIVHFDSFAVKHIPKILEKS